MLARVEPFSPPLDEEVRAQIKASNDAIVAEDPDAEDGDAENGNAEGGAAGSGDGQNGEGEDWDPQNANGQGADGQDGGTETYGFIDTFVLDPLPPHFESDMLVRFTAITAWPMGDVQIFLKLKRAELEQDERVRFRRKLGFFFGREAEDAPEDTKFDAPESRHELP